MVKMSVLYWAYFSIFGVLFPYAGRYLKSFGYDFEQIGLIMACITGANIFAPFIIARLSDITGKRVILARIAIGLLFLSIYLLSPDKGFVWTAFVALALGMSLSMALPQFEAISMEILGENKHKYGLIRLWGSLGFLCTVWLTGVLLESMGIGWFRYLQLILVGGLLLLTWTIPETVIKHDPHHDNNSGIEKLKNPIIGVLFLVMMLNQAALAPYNSFADLYWQQWNIDSLTIGTLLAIAPVAEAILMALIPIILLRFGYFPLLVVSLTLSILRWVIMAVKPDDLIFLTFSQTIHAFTFGAMHGIAIYLVAHVFSIRQQGMGQSLYVSLVAGGGLVMGNLLAGMLWKGGAGAQQVFLISAGACLIALVLSLLFLKPNQLLKHFQQ